jgi:hypothetical protein
MEICIYGKDKNLLYLTMLNNATCLGLYGKTKIYCIQQW